jgi:CubicO group peptidase (beta-lactamase class C family)
VSDSPGAAEVVRAVDQLDIPTSIDAILNRWPAVGLVVGVVHSGEPASFYSRGVADIASGTPVTEDTLFRIASITKTITALAVMQLWEQGLIDLDAPVNDYLRTFRLMPAKPSWQPATVRQLLTHTAGIGEVVRPWQAVQRDFGESFKIGRLPKLAQYYRGGIRLTSEPGTRFRYSDHGPATLGQLVEDVSGEPLNQYFHEHIFGPLGMTDSDLVRSDAVKSRLATGYEVRSRRVKAVAEREMVTAGAGSVYSSPRDMCRYLAALLGGGANEHGSVLRPATLASMFEPHYQPDPRLPGMGLAFWRTRLGDHLAVEHQGTLPGFHSQLYLAPDDGVGVVAFTNGSWQPDFWLPAECAGLLGQLLGVPEEGIRHDVPQRPQIWRDVCGWYALPGPLSDIRVRSMVGAGIEVFVRRGQLRLRFLTPIPALYRGFLLRPDDESDPYVFRIELSETVSTRVVVAQERGAGTALHLEIMPLSLRKQTAATNPRLWASGALGTLVTAGAASVLRRATRRRDCRG